MAATFFSHFYATLHIVGDFYGVGFLVSVENSLQKCLIAWMFNVVVISFAILWPLPAFLENSTFFRDFADKSARKFKNAPLFFDFFLKSEWNF